jgi:hypothetical protein
MRLGLLICALAAAYTVAPPALMQTGDSSNDSVVDYVDDSALTEETEDQAVANDAAKSYDDADTTAAEEEETTETAKHNQEAESVETPVGESDQTEEATQAEEREVDSGDEAVEYSESVTDSVLELAVLTNELTRENVQLRDENEELEAILVDAVVKLEGTRIDNNRDSGSYKQEINEEVQYREQLKQEYAESQQETGEDSQEQPELEASSAMTFVMGVALAFLGFQGAQYLLGSRLDPCLEPTMQALFADVTVLTVLWAVTFIFYYADVFEEDSFDLEKILTGLGVFILAWLLLGLWLLFTAQSHARRWISLEAECSDIRKLKNAYEEAYNERKQGTDTVFEAKREAMQYAVMRQEFIRPTYIVPVSEAILRSDFELSEYLGRCLAKVLDEALQLSWLSYCLLVIAVVLWRVMLITSPSTQLVVLAIVPLVVWAILLTLKAHLTKVYYELVPYILDPYEVHLIDNFSKEPVQNVDKIPRPPYLGGTFPGREESSEALGQHPLKLTCSFIFRGVFPNRHQTLFYFDSYGPKIILFCLQGIAIVSVLWLTVLILFYSRMLWNMLGWYSILVLAVSFGLWVLISCVYLSECVRGLCITTKLEQMKDREVIQAVVCKVKADRAIRAMKMYRKLKLIFREQNPDLEAVLTAKQQSILTEVYELEAKGGELHISALDDVVWLLGFELEEDELRLFAKECEPVRPTQNTQFKISFEKFRRAVSRMLATCQMKPEAVARRVLRTYFQQSRRREKVNHLSMTDLE